MSKVWKWCLDDNGTLLTGWQQLNNKWYYLNSNGTMAVGWVQIEDKWFYLNKDGVMQTGWLQDKGEWYYLEEQSNGHQGEMYSNGTYPISGKSYKFNSSGVWLKDNLVAKEQLQSIGWKNVSDLVLKDLNSERSPSKVPFSINFITSIPFHLYYFFKFINLYFFHISIYHLTILPDQMVIKIVNQLFSE